MVLRNGEFLNRFAVRHGNVGSSDALNGGIEVVKGILKIENKGVRGRVSEVRSTLLDHGGDLSTDAILRETLFGSDEAASLLDRVNNGLAIEGANRAEVNDLSANSVLLLELLRR